MNEATPGYDPAAIEKKITRARTALVLAHPFFASLALRLKLVVDETCETAWTDGEVMAYNPGYVDELPVDELTGLCAHTVMHPVCGHHRRHNERNPLLWNRACDYAINGILLDSGITLPRGYLYQKRFRGMNADEIYARLLELPHYQRPGENAAMSGAQGLGAAEGTAGGNQDSESDEVTLGDETPPEEKNADHEEQELDISSGGDPGKSGEVRDGKTLSEGEEKTESEDRNEWDIAIAQAANQARDMGKLPAGLARLVEEMLDPKLDWQAILLRFIEQSARNDYSWMPPNRRHIHDGLYLPSMSNRELREIVIVADTSGSISQANFDFLAVELSAILEVEAVCVHLLYCDCKVQQNHRLTREDLPLEIEATGGGGTDFRPAFTWVEDEDLQPACLVYLSDMECDQYPTEPDYPVLWARLGDTGPPPPWGELLDVTIQAEAV